MLTKSQRFRIIKAIADSLNSEDWSVIDLLLTQFGFQIKDVGSDKQSYIFDIIGGSDDQSLIDLGQHLEVAAIGLNEATPSDNGNYVAKGRMDIFISHLTAHKELAGNLQIALSRYGMECFVAHNDIHPTLQWQNEIEKALSQCDLLVALIHPGFVQSSWCDQEIGYALGRKVPVFAIKFGADPHGFVARFQAFNGNGKSPEEIAIQIFETALEHDLLQKQMAEVVIKHFEASDTFARANERVRYVDKLKTWDPAYSIRLKKALEENNQISGAYEANPMTKKIIAKWT